MRGLLLIALCISSYAAFSTVSCHAIPLILDGDSLYSIQVNGEDARTWTNCFGESAEKSLVKVSGGVVSLESNGEILSYPLVAFSKDDAAYVQSVLEQLDKSYLFFGGSAPHTETSELRHDSQTWKVQIHAWNVDINNHSKNENRAISAWKQLRSIRDPNAIAALEHQLENGRRLDVSLACLEALGGMAIKDEHALELVVHEAVTSKQEGIRFAGSLLIRQLPYSQMLRDELVKWSKTPYYQTALANLLTSGQLKKIEGKIDPVLFQALLMKITVKYKEKIPWYIWSGFDSGWVPDLTGTARGRSWYLKITTTYKTIENEIPNPLAYGMLKEYTNQDYGYDRNAWRKWLKSSAEYEDGK